MSKFEELRSDFTMWRARYIEYEREATLFAHQFTRGFREYIGAPEKYKEINERGEQPYVEAMVLTDENKLVPVDGTIDVLTREDDAYYRFGVRLVLDIAERTYPKQAFGFGIRFQLRGDRCELKIAGKTFGFALADDAGCAPIYDLMVESLKTGFAREPWDFPSKRPIGFLPIDE